MTVSYEKEISDNIDLAEADKDMYIDWLINYIDNGGEIDTYIDK